eukprot:scaffold6942_cov72-Phaeocystis_antarctica.AAC.11
MCASISRAQFCSVSTGSRQEYRVNRSSAARRAHVSGGTISAVGTQSRAATIGGSGSLNPATLELHSNSSSSGHQSERDAFSTQRGKELGMSSSKCAQSFAWQGKTLRSAEPTNFAAAGCWCCSGRPEPRTTRRCLPRGAPFQRVCTDRHSNRSASCRHQLRRQGFARYARAKCRLRSLPLPQAATIRPSPIAATSHCSKRSCRSGPEVLGKQEFWRTTASSPSEDATMDEGQVKAACGNAGADEHW